MMRRPAWVWASLLAASLGAAQETADVDVIDQVRSVEDLSLIHI